MFRYAAVLLYAYAAVALGATVDISKVNGSIEVDAGQQAGNVSTVNGSIRVGSDARVREIETVNGSVRLDPRAAAESVETVNGSVTLDEGVVVTGDASAVNGRMTLQRGASVNGRLENVNGSFDLDGATVRGGIETVNGDVTVGAGSRVENGIRVEKKVLENMKLIADTEQTIRGNTVNGRAELSWTENSSLQAGYLSKNFNDAAEQDIQDYTIKFVWRFFLGKP